MTIPLSGTGSLFKRLGRMGALLNTINGHIGNTAPSPASAWGASGPGILALKTAIDNIDGEFLASNQQLMDNLYANRDSYRAVHGQMRSYLQALAKNTLIKMADDDVALTAYDLPTALEVLISQMTATVDSVLKPTITATVATVSANGNAAVIASVLGPDGVQRDYVFAETIDVICTVDSQSGGTRYLEQFSVAGELAASDPLGWDWPKGSATSTSLTAVDANVVGPSLLTNGDFETFSVANTPDSWVISVGTPGTDIFSAGSSDAFTNSNALKLTGTGGSPLTGMHQTLTTSLLPSTVYAVNCWLKKTTSLAAGVLQIDLFDGSAVVTDDAATDNKITKTLSTLTTSYTEFNGFFRTPSIMPATAQFRVKVTTALTSGESVYLDRLAIVPATELYTGGPYAAIFSGSVKTVIGDKYTIAVANSVMSPTALAWQKLLEQFFGMRTLGLAIPSAASPTIAASVIA